MSDPIDSKGATRRDAFKATALSLGLVAGTGLATRAKAATPKRIPIRFNDPIWNRETAARIQADINGEQVFGRCSGVITGVRPGEAVRHLFNFEVFSTIRVLRQKDGNFQRMTKEAVFYSDPATGAILDEWDNPYTGERVKVVDVANDPFNWIIADTVQPFILPGNATTGQAIKGDKPYLLHWSEFGPDTIVMVEDGHGYYPNRLDPATWPRESAGSMIQASELFRYFISRADIEDPTKTFLPHNGSWVRITPWLPWMLMGQTPGHIMYDGVFRPSKTIDYHPKPVIERIKERYPQYMTAPTEWYGPNYTSLEHYAREQKPAPVKL
jgi:hypothetical protein